MGLLKFSIFLLYLYVLQSAAEPVEYPEGVEALSNSDVWLPCPGQEKDRCDDVSWYFQHGNKQDSVELVQNGVIKNKKEKINIFANCTLKIHSVSDEDGGQYSCSTHSRQAPLPVSLTVVHAEYPEAFVAQYNKNISLPCPSEDCNEPCFFQRVNKTKQRIENDRVKIFHNNCTLKISNVSDEDVGYYSCSCAPSMTQAHLHVSLTVVNVSQKKCFLLSPEDSRFSVVTDLGKTRPRPKNSKTAVWCNVTDMYTKKPWAFRFMVKVIYILTAAIIPALLILLGIVLWTRQKLVNPTQRNSINSNPDDVSYTVVSFRKRSDKTKTKDDEDGVVYSTVNYSPSVCAKNPPTPLYATVSKPKLHG